MKAFVIGVVGIGCVTAAGVGGFLAQRLSSADVADAQVIEAAQVEEAVPGQSPAEDASSPGPVTAALKPAAAPPAPVDEAPAPPRKPVRRTEAPPVQEPPPPAPPQPLPEHPVVTVPTELPTSSVPVAELPAPPREDTAMEIVDALPELEFVELTVKEDAVIGIRLDVGISSDRAKVEDPVTATVTRDVVVDGRTAIPAGARLEGDVTLVEAGGHFSERARIGVRFTRLVLSDSSTMRIETETIFRDGESPKGEATSKIGASAVVGAILGGIIGGKKGATIGGAAGAAGGTAAVARGGRNDVTLDEGTPLTVRLTRAVVLLVDRRQ